MYKVGVRLKTYVSEINKITIKNFTFFFFVFFLANSRQTFNGNFSWIFTVCFLWLFESIKGVGGHKDTASGFHWLRMGIDKPFKTWNTTWRSRYVYIDMCMYVCVWFALMRCKWFVYFFFTSFSLSVASFFVEPPLLKSCRLPRPLQPDEMSK